MRCAGVGEMGARLIYRTPYRYVFGIWAASVVVVPVLVSHADLVAPGMVHEEREQEQQIVVRQEVLSDGKAP